MTFSTAELPDEYESLRKTVEEFAHSVVAPAAAHHDATKTFPYAVVAQMGEMGLFGLPFPEEYGGMGGDYFALCLTLEELARVDQSVAITLEAAVSLGAMPVYRYGSEEQKQRWLPELASGKSLAAFGLTEPGGGTDIPGSIRTRAVDVEITRGIGAEAHGGIAGPQVIGVAVGIHSDGTNPHGPQCRRDADRDLAAVCD